MDFDRRIRKRIIQSVLHPKESGARYPHAPSFMVIIIHVLLLYCALCRVPRACGISENKSQRMTLICFNFGNGRVVCCGIIGSMAVTRRLGQAIHELNFSVKNG